MKKFSYISVLILCLAAMFAVTALGAETTFSGSYRIRSHNEYNIDKEFRDPATLKPPSPSTSWTKSDLTGLKKNWSGGE